MLNANYNNKNICSLDIRNIYGIKNIEIEKELKIASRKGLITCTDCGSILIFKSGDIKTPHFAHKELSVNCESYQTETKESEQHYKGVQYIYLKMKEKLTDAEVFVDYRLENNKRANVFIKNDNNSLAIEYICNNLDYVAWKEKYEEYNAIKQKSLWILSFSEFKNIRNNNYKFNFKILSESNKNGVVFFLNPEEEVVTFFKYLEYSFNGEITNCLSFFRSYKVSELEKYSKNIFSTKYFLEEYNIEKQKFEIEMKLKHEEILKKKNEIEKRKKEIQMIEEKAIKEMEERKKNRIKEITEKRDIQINEIREIQKKENNDSEEKVINISEERYKEALELKQQNPNGEWRDRFGDKWAVCINCGNFTKDWWHFIYPNKCECYLCKKNT